MIPVNVEASGLFNTREHFLKSHQAVRGPPAPETVGHFPTQTVELYGLEKGM